MIRKAEAEDAGVLAALAAQMWTDNEPDDLSRDVKRFAAHGYAVRRAATVDLFPRTANVETVCCLYHQKKDFISVLYEPKDAEYLK